MRIEGTALSADIAMITGDKEKPTHFRYDVFVRGGGAQVLAMKMESLSEERNFAQRYGDNSVLVAWFVDKDYKDVILPNTKDLEVIITKTQIAKPGAKNATITGSGITTRYKGTLVDSSVPEVSESNTFNHDTSNSMRSLSFQLMDRALYQLRMTKAGAILRATTAEDALKVLLTAKSISLDIDDSCKPQGVEMVPADTALKADGTANIREHVIIRPDVSLFDLAGYIQKFCGGIYNNGIGQYYKDKTWFVFPLFDNSRAGTADRTLTIIRVPADSMPDIDNSYTLRGNHLFVLATDEAISIDQSDHNQLNDGNSVIYPTATGVMSKMMPADDSVGFASESDVMGRVSVESRPDGLNNASFNVQTATDNTAAVLSKLARASQQMMQFGWAYSDPSLLYPGMPTRVLYNKNGVIETMQGTLIGGDSFTEMATPGMATEHYQTKTALTVLVAKAPDKRA
jgi:hypothetical protein